MVIRCKKNTAISCMEPSTTQDLDVRTRVSACSSRGQMFGGSVGLRIHMASLIQSQQASLMVLRPGMGGVCLQRARLDALLSQKPEPHFCVIKPPLLIARVIQIKKSCFSFKSKNCSGTNNNILENYPNRNKNVPPNIVCFEKKQNIQRTKQNVQKNCSETNKNVLEKYYPNIVKCDLV